MVKYCELQSKTAIFLPSMKSHGNAHFFFVLNRYFKDAVMVKLC